jgi:hypothetical protein
MDNELIDILMEDYRIEELSEMNMIDSEFMEWLYENKMLDEDTFNEETSDSNDQWRMDNINSIQQSLNTFKKYITDQANQNSSWLSKNNDIILNANKYPVRNGANIKQAPDYKSAINRIKTPISTNLSGIDLKRIELPNQDPTQPKQNDQQLMRQNLWLKKMFISTYNGETEFQDFAKIYYYGKDKVHDISTQELQQFLPSAYNFCNSINTFIKSLETDIHGYINYINRNPITGNTENPITQTQINNNNMNTAVNKSNTANMATGNATSNTSLNADTDFTLFYNKYFGDLLSEAYATSNSSLKADIDFTLFYNKHFGEFYNKHFGDSLSEADTTQSQQQNATNQQQQTSTAKPKMTFDNKNTSGQNGQKQNGEDSDTTVWNKKKLVCNLVRQILSTKMTVSGMIYRDMMSFMQTHVNSYSKGTQNTPNQPQPQQQNQQQKVNDK